MITVIKPSWEWADLSLWKMDKITEHLEKCGRTCYRSEDRITPDSADKFVRKICRKNHVSVLEHEGLTARIVCSRAASHQLVRHRIAAYCLSGDTEVVAFTASKRRSPKRWTLKQLYEWSSDPKRKGRLQLIRLRSVDNEGRLVPGKIRKVFDSGEQEVFEVKTRFGRSIKATAKHRFLTDDGWKPLAAIKVGDKLFSNGLPAYKNPAVMSVFQDEIVSITPAGLEHTYDIEMEGPNHNFVANGLVVHNSQESMRYVNYGKRGLQVICPPSIGVPPGEYTEYGIGGRGLSQIQIDWLCCVEMCYTEYLRELDQGVRPEDARFVLPHACKTEVIATYNMRTWRHVIEERGLNKHAQWEIREIFHDIYEHLRWRLPAIFEDLE